MMFEPTELPGVKLIRNERKGDARGYFARTFCAREMAEHGINPNLAQSSHSFNAQRGTIRGLHFQASPAMEDKLVRCLQGAIFDVMVDLRIGSPTFGRWMGAELTADNDLQLFSPRGFAHGFQTLTDDTIVGYHIAQFYEADKTAGVAYDDPDIAIRWPLVPTNLSPRDLTLPRLSGLNRDQLIHFGSRACVAC